MYPSLNNFGSPNLRSARVCERLMDIHDVGVCHNDMTNPHRNIVLSGNDVRIIDFELSNFHECQRCYKDEIYIDGFAPPKKTFGCGEVYHVCKELLWTPGRPCY